MKEANIEREIQIAISKAGGRIFRNARGKYQDPHSGAWITYGLGPDGAADEIGWTPVLVTADMVGKTIAVFTSIEVKRPKKTAREDQERWASAVAAAGGISGVATSPEEALDLIRNAFSDSVK